MKYTVFVFILFGIACQKRQQIKNETVFSGKQDAIQLLLQDSIAKVALREKAIAELDSLASIAKLRPIWGKRMQVTGDFDGDGIQDTLHEKYISLKTGKETNKDYDFSVLGDGADWIGYHQKWIGEKAPLVQLKCTGTKIKPFNVESGGVQWGFDYLKNVGDLNGDSTDEIAYYIYDVDFSSMNSAALATYKNGRWKEVCHWEISEHDFMYEKGGSQPNPTYIKKKNGKVYYKEMDFGSGDYIWKHLKTNW